MIGSIIGAYFAGFILLGLLVAGEFIKYLVTGSRLLGRKSAWVLDVIVVVGYSVFYLSLFDVTLDNDCCATFTATFSPEHRLSIYVVIGLCILAFCYSRFRHQMAPPIPEVIVQTLLLVGILLNIALIIHLPWMIALMGNVPILLLFLYALLSDQRTTIRYLREREPSQPSLPQKWAWRILSFQLLYKIPILLLLSIPLLMMVSLLLLLFGQKPDSLISSFTDTYRYGLSQMDYVCDHVQCDEHFLCSIGASGHTRIVRPQRLGVRAQHTIICNRQLLVANAFEELLQQKAPRLHQFLRHQYNKVGHWIHTYFWVFNNKWMADCSYLCMKPFEWIFLLCLYTFDQTPENRIAQQYLASEERQLIKNTR